ncbi:MAG: hypothetical protein ACJ77B_12385 [Chloroflexota bacterium]
MTERPAERLELAVAPVGRAGKRGRWSPIVWLAALGIVAAVAILGQRGADTAAPVVVAAATPAATVPPRVAAVPPPWVTNRRVAAPRTGRVLGEDGLMGSLTIDRPAPAADYRYLKWLTRFVDPTEL